jgi:hypothetical protein
MAAPDRVTIIQRLKSLLDQLSSFKSRSFSFAGEPEFETWRDEVIRWLENAGPYAKQEAWEFSYIIFVGHRGDLPRIWQAALQKADRVLNAVIENLENDWSAQQPEPARLDTSVKNAPVPQPRVQIINQQNLALNFRDITVEQMLDRIAEEVKGKSPEKAGWLRTKIREILDDPVIKDYYARTVEAVLRSQSK